MNGNDKVWDEARIAELTALWALPHYSATAIGVAMGMGRNAILGKAFRLKLARRKPVEPKGPQPKPPRMFIPRPIKPPKPPSNKLGIVRTSIGASAISPDTGEYLTYRRLPRERKLTKTELRAQLTQAVINTGGTK